MRISRDIPKKLRRKLARYRRRMRWQPWTTAEVMRRLEVAGCKCRQQTDGLQIRLANGQIVTLAPAISMDSISTMGRPNSYRARHCCHGCGATIFESVDEHRCITCNAWIDDGDVCKEHRAPAAS